MKNLKTLKLALLTLSVVITCSCTELKNKTDIDGLWISTEETSMKFLSGTQKTVVQISHDSTDDLNVKGFFMWNDHFLSDWELDSIKYDVTNNTVLITDADGGVFKGVFEKNNEKLVGAIYTMEDGTEELLDSLILVRAGENLESELLYARIPGKNGEIDYVYKEPGQLDDGLQTTSVYNEDIDSEQIIDLINKIIEQEYGRVESILILKDNKLLVEEYFYGYDRSQLHHIYSCTKSITSLLLGIAIDQNKNIDINQSVFDFFPGLDSIKTKEKEQITLKNMLTMTAGLDWDEYPMEMYETDDRVKYVLGLPMKADPGDEFLYNSGLSVIIGEIIDSGTDIDIKEFADEYLFHPLGITEYEWKTNKNGNLEFWNGLRMKPRDMAKIGLLILNEGKWDDKQIVAKDWINESVKPHVSESDYFDYGYQWWLRTNKTRQWWEEEQTTDKYNMAVALGWGSQFIIIIKDLNLVVVSTGSNFSNPEKEFSIFPMITNEIIPSFER